ncbi:hypothetical protein [Actinomadura spongiicola]|uniref:hypothetical protein n=1 Tax=Actinomadura spongiicola TaxID=2303421 RepID=UPI0018F26447|nr:hypothetical protein [Actinomadura spongiicola]
MRDGLMGQDYFPLMAETENGEFIGEPSEDAVFGLIVELAGPDNTFVIIEPDEDDPAWFASVSLLDDGRYEVELRDPTHHRHKLSTDTSPDKIANAVTHWITETARAHARLRKSQR